jgi:hypothetical protein
MRRTNPNKPSNVRRPISPKREPDEPRDIFAEPEPRETEDDPDETGEFDEIDPDDPRWDAFIADDDERDPEPEYGDFWPID